MSDNIFTQAQIKANAHENPSTHLDTLGVNVEAAMDEAMEFATKIVVGSEDTFDLVCNVASLFMTGVSVGVEIPALAAERGEPVAN
jgi:hypothetical protein